MEPAPHPPGTTAPVPRGEGHGSLFCLREPVRVREGLLGRGGAGGLPWVALLLTPPLTLGQLVILVQPLASTAPTWGGW